MAYIHVYSTRINWENEPSIVSPINATNLNKMDYALKAMDDTFGSWDITKANESDLLLALKDVSYDTDTGVFVFTWFNGTTSTIDLNIEKIPVSFSMDANGVITMTTEDGTTYTADVGALIKTYTFTDSSVIDFNVTTDASGNKTVTADIVDGSIDGNKLTPNYLADCTQAKTGAETAATNSAASSQDAEAWAVGTRGGVPVPSTDPAYENNAEYWAHHTSSSLAGLTDTNISSPSDGEVLKYNSTTSKWENGQAAAGGGSTIAVSTSESALYGQNVTLTDGATTLTETFDSAGHATFSGVTMTGNLTIASGTASTSLNVPYFGNYTAVVSSFSASITVTYPGGTCTCVGNGESYTASSSPYTFTVHGAATYTITVTIDGVSKTDTVVITTDGQTETSTIEFGTINVTYENDFKGVSITCTLGATTITKTAPTTGNTMSFYPPTTGQWTISGTVGGVPYSTTANVTSLSTPVSVTLETIPDGSTTTPTDDIQKWLACAGIKDKAYTTLSQVLGDSETYNALLGDSNACAYMARSTTWTTDICASQYAMSMIGQYDVCCDALLSDETWASAIINSSYADYVIDVKVPTMTSNTTPSGTAFASSEYSASYPAWKAFDNNTSTFWGSSVADAIGSTVGYEFTSAVIVSAVKIVDYGGTNRPTNVTIQGYDTEWHDIKTFDRDTQTTLDSIQNTTPYTKYRVKTNAISGTVGTHNPAIEILQFYGRTPSNELIHGTNNESAYYLDGATQTPIVDPSTLSAGTYTFGSTVAKDPSDLTADYTKTIRITPNTKEIVLRPDNALYWWGYESANCEELSIANGWSTTVSNYSFVSPTYNDYDISITGAGAKIKGIGTKNAISASTVHIISQCTLQNSGYGLYVLASLTTKSINGTNTINQSTLNTVQHLSASVSGTYISAECIDYRNGVIYALWYE